MYWAMETIMVEAAADGDASPGKPWRRCVRLRRRGATPHRERQRTDMSNVAVVLGERLARYGFGDGHPFGPDRHGVFVRRSEEHTSELQSRLHLVCRLLLEKKKRQLCVLAHRKRIKRDPRFISPPPTLAPLHHNTHPSPRAPLTTRSADHWRDCWCRLRSIC